MTLPAIALLAGGLATRMRPLTETIPKSLIEVAGEPFLAHQLRLLRDQGFERVVICAGYLAEMMMEFTGDGSAFGLSVEYSLDGERLLGTGGALARALPRLGEDFVVLYGDSYLPYDYRPIVAHFRASGRKGLMTVFANHGRWDTSNVEFEDGMIRRYDKAVRTDAMRHIDWGLGCLRAEVLAGHAPDEVFDLADVYKSLVAEGQLVGYEVAERFYEIGSPAGLAETDALLKGK